MDTTSPDQLSERDRRRLDDLHVRLQRETLRFAGYPCSALFNCSPLYRFLAFTANNIGDPYVLSNYHLNTREFEREVLDEFFALTHAPTDASWGYVTNGGTEGNMYGIFLARELLPDGVVSYSEDPHWDFFQKHPMR